MSKQQKPNFQVKPEEFPITLAELMERARKQPGTTPGERIWLAMTRHEDTLEFLQRIESKAFVKGVATRSFPAAKSSGEALARKFAVASVFAFAKNLEGKEIKLPNGEKVTLEKRDYLPATRQYGLGGGESPDLSAYSALERLKSLDFTAEVKEPRRQDSDWAHGEDQTAPMEAELREAGAASANTLAEALHLLEGEQGAEAAEAREVLKKTVMARTLADKGVVKRTYATGFSVYEESWTEFHGNGEEYTPIFREEEEREALAQAMQGSVAIRGNWDSLNVPRRLKPQAFDRLVELLVSSIQLTGATSVTCDTDDIVGRAATVAAKRLSLNVVTIAKAGKAHELGDFDARVCQYTPKVPKARQRVQGMVNEAIVQKCAMLLTIGEGELVEGLAAAFKSGKHQKPVTRLDTRWAKHNGLYEFTPKEEELDEEAEVLADGEDLAMLEELSMEEDFEFPELD